VTVRDLAVVAGCLLGEPQCLSASMRVAKCWPPMTQTSSARSCAADGELMRSLRFQMAGEPLTGEPSPTTAPRILAPYAA